MIKTGREYRESIRGTREVYRNGEPVKDVTAHPMFKPIVDIRAHIYRLQHDPEKAPIMTVTNNGERNADATVHQYFRDRADYGSNNAQHNHGQNNLQNNPGES